MSFLRFCPFNLNFADLLGEIAEISTSFLVIGMSILARKAPEAIHVRIFQPKIFRSNDTAQLTISNMLVFRGVLYETVVLGAYRPDRGQSCILWVAIALCVLRMVDCLVELISIVDCVSG